MDFPAEILFPSRELPGAARLKVAVLVALLDHGMLDDVEFTDSEIAPFIDEAQDCYLSPHAFISVEPIGNLAIAAKKITQAMGDSIKINQLKTVATRFNFNGDIDPINTWLRLSDAAEWMLTRGMETGDLFSNLWDDEEKVFDAAATAGDAVRLKLEIPDVEPELSKLRAEANWDEGTNEIFTNLLRENAALRGGGRRALAADRPLKERERTTLLTIIAALCKEAKIDYTKPAKAAGLIQGTAALMQVSIGETTIEGHLKKIPDALATRMK
jgi:hypothetical protein